MIIVTLTQDEIDRANSVGALREQHNRAAGIVDLSGPQMPDGERPDAIGSIGELAVHNWLGLEWAGKTDRPDQGGDVAGWIEVKTTAHLGGHLVQSPLSGEKQRAKQHRAFLLVVWRKPHASILGWLWGWELLDDANMGDHFNNGRPCWAVPQGWLRRPETLLDLEQKGKRRA